MPDNPRKSLPNQRRNELLNAIDSVVERDDTDNKEGLRELLKTTAWMENTVGHNPNAYGRTYTNGPMSLDNVAYKDLFSPVKDKNGVSTGRFSEYQRKILGQLEEFGYNDLDAFTDSLKSDDPLASVLAARFYYGLNPAPIPQPKDKEGMFNYYKDNYNKGGMDKYQDEETAINRFNSYYDSELNQPSVSLIAPGSQPESQPNLTQVDNVAPAESTGVNTPQVRDINFSTQEGTVRDISQGNGIDIKGNVNPQPLEEQPVEMANGGQITNQLVSTGVSAINPLAGAIYNVAGQIGQSIQDSNPTNAGNQIAGSLLNPASGISNAFEKKDASYAIPIYGGIKAAQDAKEDLRKNEAIESAANFTANQESQATVLGRSNQRQSNTATPKRFMALGGLLDGFSETKDIKGRTHAQGGVPMGKNIEVEGGEVRHKNFIFTNRF